jgi:hypothetical protein
VTVVALGTAVALNWETLALRVSFLTAERRPALLSDAKWKNPASALMFSSRFANGVHENELIDWLESNNFTVDRKAGRASRLVQSLPCNEAIEVTWSRQPDGTIAGTEALVSEAGCL